MTMRPLPAAAPANLGPPPALPRLHPATTVTFLPLNFSCPRTRHEGNGRGRTFMPASPPCGAHARPGLPAQPRAAVRPGVHHQKEILWCAPLQPGAGDSRVDPEACHRYSTSMLLPAARKTSRIPVMQWRAEGDL